MFLWIRYDFWLHAMMGYIITLTLGLFGYLHLGLILTFVLAIVKEIRDHFHPKTKFDWWDIVWTIIGIVPAILILSLIQ